MALTAVERERLGVLENEVKYIKDDVTEIKKDVKLLVANQTLVAQQLAVRTAQELLVSTSRTSTGMWLRFLSERVIALVAIVVAVYAALSR